MFACMYMKDRAHVFVCHFMPVLRYQDDSSDKTAPVALNIAIRDVVDDGDDDDDGVGYRTRTTRTASTAWPLLSAASKLLIAETLQTVLLSRAPIS